METTALSQPNPNESGLLAKILFLDSSSNTEIGISHSIWNNL